MTFAGAGFRDDPDRARGRQRTRAGLGLGAAATCATACPASTARRTSGCVRRRARGGARSARGGARQPAGAFRSRVRAARRARSADRLARAGARRGSLGRGAASADRPSAPELMRRRGTRAGLELALELAFPACRSGSRIRCSVTWSREQPGPAETEPPSFVVYCDVPLPEHRACGGRAADRSGQAGPRELSPSRAGAGRAGDGDHA